MNSQHLESIEDNPSFSGDIRLYSHSGLCNRLRLIAEYKHLSDTRDKAIEMFWVKSPQCNRVFDDLFKPIPNINFHHLKWKRDARQMRPKNTAQRLGLFPHDEEIKNKNHLIFRPVDSIMKTIENVKNMIGDDYISCHIRRTDIVTIQNKHKIEPPTNKFFEDFIDKYPRHKVLLATDNRNTQIEFSKKFGSRLYLSTIVNGNGNKRWPKRTTSIPNAVTDLFLCIGSHDFIGTTCSSFSTFIENYRKGMVCHKKTPNNN